MLVMGNIVKNKITSEIKNGIKIIHCEHIDNEECITPSDYKEIMKQIALLN